MATKRKSSYCSLVDQVFTFIAQQRFKDQDRRSTASETHGISWRCSSGRYREESGGLLGLERRVVRARRQGVGQTWSFGELNMTSVLYELDMSCLKRNLQMKCWLRDPVNFSGIFLTWHTGYSVICFTIPSFTTILIYLHCLSFANINWWTSLKFKLELGRRSFPASRGRMPPKIVYRDGSHDLRVVQYISMFNVGQTQYWTLCWILFEPIQRYPIVDLKSTSDLI